MFYNDMIATTMVVSPKCKVRHATRTTLSTPKLNTSKKTPPRPRQAHKSQGVDGRGTLAQEPPSERNDGSPDICTFFSSK